jgi:hypothetical protein
MKNRTIKNNFYSKGTLWIPGIENSQSAFHFNTINLRQRGAAPAVEGEDFNLVLLRSPCLSQRKKLPCYLYKYINS